MKIHTCRFLALAAAMALYPIAASYADSTTPPSEQGSTSGTMPPHTSSTTVGSSDTMSTTNSTPKLDNKVPPGNNASPSH